MAALCPHGQISLINFSVGLSPIIVYSVFTWIPFFGLFVSFLTLAYGILIPVAFVQRYQHFDFKVAVRALGLGLAFSTGFIWSLYFDTNCQHFAWYLTALSFFHWSEYFTTALTNPKNLSLDSYLLDHSREYHIAAFLSCIEYSLELYFLPGMKGNYWISRLGLCMILGGELLRKLSMFTALSNFNHYIQRTKDSQHRLVTHGVYGFFRHPSYVGWFYWSVGTQVMLSNPFCFLGYAWASWRFFKARIEDEEIMLITFFGQEYLDYQKKVGTGLPFIEGCRVDPH